MMTIDIEKCKRCEYWNGTACTITMCVKIGEKIKESEEKKECVVIKCPNCGTKWFRVKRLIIEWIEERKESEDENDI